jgi:hypothetical protein
MSNSSNPLAKHFRQPALYIKLTSKGKFWREGTLDQPAIGEIPVYPMTAKDEIILRTPDALVNGTSVVQVIESCCPNVKDAWAMPSVDVDSTLIAIRIASYGEKMPITSKCPHCGEENEYDLDLNHILQQVQMPDYSTPVKTEDGLEIFLKPMDYAHVSRAGAIQLEEEKLIQALSDPDLDEEIRKAEYEKHIQKMIELNLDNITGCTDYILAGDTKVSEEGFIREYYSNAEAEVMREIQARIAEYGKSAGLKPYDTTCSDCGNGFQMNVDFDYSSFFAKGF